MKYFFDSSAIYTIVKAGRPEMLARNYTCSLARYETGNVLVTETKVKKTISETEQMSLLSLIMRAMNLMLSIDVKNYEHAVSIVALKLNLSFYDASYVYFAKALGAVLVTEDGKLARKTIIIFSPALNLCNLARGKIDGFVDIGTTPEDHAAGYLIAKEAGGKVQNYHSDSWNVGTSGIIASNSKIQSSLLKLTRNI